jgi:hypothetical protein
LWEQREDREPKEVSMDKDDVVHGAVNIDSISGTELERASMSSVFLTYSEFWSFIGIGLKAWLSSLKGEGRGFKINIMTERMRLQIVETKLQKSKSRELATA